MIIARKIFLPNFGDARAPPASISYTYEIRHFSELQQLHCICNRLSYTIDVNKKVQQS